MAKKKKSSGKGRARAAGRFIAKGGKTTGIAALTGVASHFVMKWAAGSSETLREHWAIVPAVMIGGGHFIRRKSEAAGLALVGAGAALGAMVWDARKAAAETTGLQEVEGLQEPTPAQLAEGTPFSPMNTATAPRPAAAALM